MNMPMVSAVYAAVLGLLATILTIRVIVNRVRFKVNAGDGGKAELAQAIRAHANFAEHAPFALLLIALAEAAGAQHGVIHGLGAALVVGRLASAWALSGSLGPTPPRQFGASVTILVVAAASLLIFYRAFIA
ncbi:MAG TPA: MAPEG family protein [Burkholderiales bacterium]